GPEPCPTCPVCPPPAASSAPAPPATPAPPAAPPAGPLGFTPMLGVGALIGVATPFELAPGVSLSGGLRGPCAPLGLEVHALLLGPGDRQGQRLDTVSTVADLVPCGHLSRWFACAIAEGGVMRLFGPDAALAQVHVVGLLSAGFRAGVEWQPSSR